MLTGYVTIFAILDDVQSYLHMCVERQENTKEAMINQEGTRMEKIYNGLHVMD